VLLPVTSLLRRADAVVVIGAALVAAAGGAGHRRIAERLGRSASTVRGWLRRFGARAGPLREAFTALAAALEPAPRTPDPAGSGLGDAVAAVLVTARAVGTRWPELLGNVSAWQVACAVTAGRLLAPALPMELINTSRLWRT
jgi:hypothetical protein